MKLNRNFTDEADDEMYYLKGLERTEKPVVSRAVVGFVVISFLVLGVIAAVKYANV